MQYIKSDNIAQANKFINQCLNLYGNTKYGESLKKFKEELNARTRKKQVYDLFKKGLSTAQIAGELKMLEVDIINMVRSFDRNGGPGGRDQYFYLNTADYRYFGK